MYGDAQVEAESQWGKARRLDREADEHERLARIHSAKAQVCRAAAAAERRAGRVEWANQ